VRIVLSGEADVAHAAATARRLALDAGLSSLDAVQVATAVSEVARNAVLYAGGGDAELVTLADGLRVVVADDGPGIADTELALRDGWSSAGSLGLGLPGARRLMDEFALASAPGRGTTVTMAKRRAQPGGTLDWRVAGDGVHVAAQFRHGILLGVLDGPDAARAAAELARVPGEAPAPLAERCRALRAAPLSMALASCHMLDASVTWLAAGEAEAELHRPGAGLVAAAPRFPTLRGDAHPALRARSLAMLRGDALVLRAPGVRVEARVLRGALDRRAD
jgi:serine/threonine-protein kinase RsbT